MSMLERVGVCAARLRVLLVHGSLCAQLLDLALAHLLPELLVLGLHAPTGRDTELPPQSCPYKAGPQS
eukprot:6214626-Pleurochrysis_carterae.AAC.3